MPDYVQLPEAVKRKIISESEVKHMLNIVGTIRLGTDTDISDPAFSWTDWKKLSVPTEEGEYNCCIEKDEDGKIRKIEVVKKDADVTEDDWWKSLKMGFVSSRSGLCGFFNNKPDYTMHEWEDLKNSLYSAGGIENQSEVFLECQGTGDAFYTASGKNGSFPVRGCRRKGRYYALRLIFNV